MTKVYGVSCDRCKVTINYPSIHYRIRIACVLNNLDEIKADICPNCYEAVRNFLKVYEAVKEINEQG
jgi:hypothetical protein